MISSVVVEGAGGSSVKYSVGHDGVDTIELCEAKTLSGISIKYANYDVIYPYHRVIKILENRQIKDGSEK